jgi:hypothetical protein
VTTSKNDYDLLADYIQELEQEITKKVLAEEPGKEIIKKPQYSK